MAKLSGLRGKTKINNQGLAWDLLVERWIFPDGLPEEIGRVVVARKVFDGIWMDGGHGHWDAVCAVRMASAIGASGLAAILVARDYLDAMEHIQALMAEL